MNWLEAWWHEQVAARGRMNMSIPTDGAGWVITTLFLNLWGPILGR